MSSLRLTPGIAAIAIVTVLAGCGAGDREVRSDASVPRLTVANDPPVPDSSPATAHANWRSRPSSFREAARRSTAAVIATVTDVAAGRSIDAASDEVSPTTVVTLMVRDRWFGAIPDQFKIVWVGTPAGGFLEGDPPYVAGQDYVLLLTKRGDIDAYRPESPDGRLQILADGLRPVIDGPPADEMRGRQAAEAKREAQEAKR